MDKSVETFIFGMDEFPEWFQSAIDSGEVKCETRAGNITGCIINNTEFYSVGDIIPRYAVDRR